MNVEDNLEFFQEGLRSYMDAMRALGQFRQEVKKKAERVLTSNLQELGRALGAPLEREKRDIYAYPAGLTNLRETEWWVTTRLRVPQFECHFGLVWLEEGSEILLFALGGFWFSDAGFRDRAKQALGGGDSALWESSGGGLYLRERLTLEEAASFEKKLENILRKWIELWEKAGGLRGVQAGHS